MKAFIEEFKQFAMRGNVMDLAVGVVIGGAFGKIVSSLVTNIVSPILGILMGGINLNYLSLKIGAADITYGVFLQSIIDFVIVAFAIFVAIKLMNRLQKKEDAKPEEAKTVEPTEDIKLLREIRDALYHTH